MVVISPSSIPLLSLTHFTSGARAFVGHEAYEKKSVCPLYPASFMPITIVSESSLVS
jgi:hypothetical protein